MNQYHPKEAADIVKQIEQANEPELEEILNAVMRRYSVLRPDRELATYSLSTDPQVRNVELEEMFQFIRACYNPKDSQ